MLLTDDARYQHGVFSRRQALESGMSAKLVRRRLTDGSWVEPVSNVYADAGLVMTPTAWQWAAVLSCGATAVLSHRSAAQLWEMPVKTPPRPEVSVPNGMHPRPGRRVKVHAMSVPAHELSGYRGLPVTSQQRTVLDCLLSLPADQARTLLDRALQRGWVQLPGIVRAVHEARGRHGIARARAVLTGADPGIASQGERVAQALLTAGGVTGWTGNYKLVAGGQVVAVLDIAFPHLRLAIEIDGWAWHNDPKSFQEDRRRQNALVTAGWTVLRFTWADLVERPEQVLATIVRTLARLATAS